MTAGYTISVASHDQLLAAHRNQHESWHRGMSLDEFVAFRLRSVRHNRAQWWVLTVAGDVVASLACYPMQFCYRRRVVKGIGIGSVHTRPAERGKGYAAALCRETARVAAGQGHELAFLYSDIDPGYYERLGYRSSAAFSHRCDCLAQLAGSGPQADLVPFDPQEHLDLLADHYIKAHRLDELFIWRDRDYWFYTLRKDPADLFFQVRHQGKDAGYLRLAERPDWLGVIEVALTTPEVEEAVYRSAAAFALTRGRPCMIGWLRPSALVGRCFTTTPRGKGIPMLCSLGSRIQLDMDLLAHGCHFWVSDHF